MIRLPQQQTKTLLAIHGWSGVFLGLLLYAVILTGVASVFADEIADWSSPLSQPLQERFPSGSGAAIKAFADTVDPQYHEDMFAFPRAGGRLYAFFHKHDQDEDGKPIDRGVQADIDPATMQVIARNEGTGEEIEQLDVPNALAHFFVELHVRLHVPDPWGLLLTGVLGLAMMVAAVTGFVIHRHLIKEMFTLRRHKEALLRERDTHVLAGTWNLPFAFILAFTGSFYSFAGSFGIPAMAMVAFGGDQEKMIETVVGNPPASDPAPAPVADLDAMFADARQRAGSDIYFLSAQHWGRKDALVSLYMMPLEGALTGTTYTYSGATGAFQTEKPGLGKVASVGGALYTLMGPLHFGNFAGVLSKAVWFALGFAGAYVTLTGLTLWTQRRIEQPVWRRLGRAVLWVGYGLPLSLVAAAYGYFPVRTVAGADVPGLMMTVFLCTAAVCGLLAATLTPELVKRVLLAATGLALMGLPLLRWITGGPGWPQAFEAGLLIVPSLDIAVALAGALCLRAARRSKPLAAPATSFRADTPVRSA